MQNPPNQSKKQLRREIRHRRRSLSAQQQREHAQAVQKKVFQSGLLNRCSRVASYAASDGELNLNSLSIMLLQMGKRVSLPRILPHSKLEFRSMSSDLALLPNQYGIAEPDPGTSTRIPLWTHSVILMPLVAFDASGNRLGMGGGYYDRVLSRLNQRPLCIGVGHELQYYPNLTTQAWDEKMDAVFTETRLRIFSTKASLALKVF